MTKQIFDGANIGNGEPIQLQTDETVVANFPVTWPDAIGRTCTVPDGSTIESGGGTPKKILTVHRMHLGGWAILSTINT